jgi:hypothetical protein
MRSVQKEQIPHNFAVYVPGLLTIGDIDDVVAGIAPRAFGMSHGLQDRFFPMEGVRQIHAKAKKVFQKNKLLTILFDDVHCFPASVKRQAYAFLKKHLK